MKTARLQLYTYELGCEKWMPTELDLKQKI